MLGPNLSYQRQREGLRHLIATIAGMASRACRNNLLPMYHLSVETEHDRLEVEYLFDAAFAPGRTALSSYRLRDGIDPVADLCLVARDDLGILAGAVRHWPVEIGDEGRPALLLGPIAVHHTRQGEGLGAELMAAALDAATALGWMRVVLVGDEPYYRRFGFRHAPGLVMPPPTNPDRILAQALVAGGMDGVTGVVRPWSGGSADRRVVITEAPSP